MSYDYSNRDGYNNGSSHSSGRNRDDQSGRNRDRDEVYSNRVLAGKRTYFFDVKSTRSGEDFFITITESKRVGEGRYEKHKVFLYKEDFGKFVNALHDVVNHIKTERLPDYDFRGLPDYLPEYEDEEADEGSDY